MESQTNRIWVRKVVTVVAISSAIGLAGMPLTARGLGATEEAAVSLHLGVPVLTACSLSITPVPATLSSTALLLLASICTACMETFAYAGFVVLPGLFYGDPIIEGDTGYWVTQVVLTWVFTSALLLGGRIVRSLRQARR